MKTKNSVKILLVDDREENLFALEVILSNQNYLFVKANSGNEALKILLHEQDFAIILMDVQMPEMDGFETVELIRDMETLKHVPIIFLTASMDNSAHVFKGYQAGAVDYMIKPISPEILIAKVAVFVELYLKTHELIVQKEQLNLLNQAFHTQKLLSEYSQSLIEASHDPLFAINQNGKITDMNNASIKVIGMSREKIIATDFFDYFTDTQMARKVYKEVFEKGFVADAPLMIRHNNGKLTHVFINGAVYKDDQKNVLGVVLVARDVTAQKQFENALIEAKMKAECATRKAEEAVKAKQQFLSNMSHEIRTPMNAIIGFTKVVLKTELTKEQNEYITAIKTSGDSLMVIIDDILDLAKVDSGKMIFEKNPFSLATSFSYISQLFELKIKENNLTWIKELDAAIPEVIIGDSTRLHQIMLNLIGNAVKFTSQGSVIMRATLLSQKKDKLMIEFSISDTGIGISPEMIEAVFENFQQASTGTSRLYGGTGLGLSIVKQLVEYQGGTISVKSTLGEGSTFKFILPFTKSDVNLEIQNEAIVKASLKQKIKILIVEDMPLNQLLMKTILDDFGFERDVVENGKKAIEKLQNNTYDVLLMDLQMPVMNGYEATDYIRNVLKLNVPIIALTADVTTSDLQKCLAIGMNDYVAKPVDDKDLHRKIMELVRCGNAQAVDPLIAMD